MANERTALAWRRSALSLLTVAGLLVHAGREGPLSALVVGLGIALGLMALGVDRHGHRLYRTRARGADACGPSSPRALAALSAVTILAAMAALVVGLR